MAAIFKILNPVEEEINFDSFMKFPLLLLRIPVVAFTPLPERATLKEKINYYSRRTYNIFLIINFYWALASKIILTLNSKNMTDASPLILDVVTYILNCFKALILIMYQDEIKNLFEEIKSIFDRRVNQTRKYGVRKYLDSYHRLAVMYSAPVMMLILFVALPIVPFLLFGTMQLPLDYWYPFDTVQVKNYLFAYFWSYWVMISILVALLGNDIMLYAMITVIEIEFDVLKKDLTHIGDSPKNKEFIQTLVDHHINLLNLCDRLQNIYSKMFLFSFVISSLVMCFLSYQLSTNFDNLSLFAFYFFYLWMMGAQILLLCVFGQKLINSSESISEGVYNSGWEGISDDEAYKKQLVMIISRAQRPKRLTAMGFADISIETFTTVSLLQ